ncbi:DegV family protein with EDD domain [Alkalibacillus filiformis]|uniref:DegV family protein with EDD domain n=1 Tax=Alkalibacillus filiformis TaxID=200990 RepID=A0ABU0DTY1_9BACI|nr:DegV family protein [Alkalibacillus filiformis]MDQ0351748.1 DegV family protein with EDD domain [Alkalibacillus filiformis]
MSVKLIVDSGSDLPKDILEQHDIDIVSLIVHLDGQDYYDRDTIDSQKVYDAMRKGSAPKTAQATPDTFYDVFKQYTDEGRPVVYLAFSSELSGTYQSAMIAKQQIEDDNENAEIYIIDTRAASMGHGLVAYHTAEAIANGGSVQDILDTANFYVNHMVHIFTVDDLEYLQRGGRVSKAQAFVGGMLKIKPLLHVEDGKLVPLEKVRGSKKVIGRMVDLAGERGSSLDQQTIAITHGDDEETAQKLAEKLKEAYSPQDIIIHQVGSAIGAHSGPGTIALFFLDDIQ